MKTRKIIIYCGIIFAILTILVLFIPLFSENYLVFEFIGTHVWTTLIWFFVLLFLLSPDMVIEFKKKDENGVRGVTNGFTTRNILISIAMVSLVFFVYNTATTKYIDNTRSEFMKVFNHGENIKFGDKTKLDDKNTMYLTEYDTLVNYYSDFISEYKTNREFLRCKNRCKNSEPSDIHYIDSIGKWCTNNQDKLECYMRYLETVENHKNKYDKTIELEYYQPFEIVINDKLSYFGQILISSTNGKISSYSIKKIKCSYLDYQVFKRTSKDCK